MAWAKIFAEWDSQFSANLERDFNKLRIRFSGQNSCSFKYTTTKHPQKVQTTSGFFPLYQ